MSGEPVIGSLYVYAPNQWAPIPFIMIFAISGLIHIWQCYKYRTIVLTGYQTICAILFTIGFGLREYGSMNTNYLYQPKINLTLYILSQVFIYTCPPLLEFGNYHILSRSFAYIPHKAPIPARTVNIVFGTVILTVECVNSLGIALFVNPGNSQTLGGILVIVAIVTQLVLIASFTILGGIFWKRSHFNSILTPLYISMGLILVRSIYRLIDHSHMEQIQITNLTALQNLSPLHRYEWFFYVFEALPMLLNSILWNIANPGRHLPSNKRVHLAEDGIEVIDNREKGPWPLWAKILCVLSFGILFRRRPASRSSGESILLAERPQTNKN